MGAERLSPTPTRSLAELTTFPEQEKTRLVICTDVEGPLFTGDFIAEAMSEKVKPSANATEAFPTYGDLIYEITWKWFNRVTLENRKRPGLNSAISSISQEGEDTLFTMPILLACSVDEYYLEQMTLASKQTPGSQELVHKLQLSGALVVGITTAPQEPYRKLLAQTHLMDPRLLIGSPFPLNNLKERLNEAGLFNTEIEIVKAYLNDCFKIIDDNSDIMTVQDEVERRLSDEGERMLIERIETFHNFQLGITYELNRRKIQREIMLSGQVIEGHRILGDRAKVAVAQLVSKKYRSTPGAFVTIGDGLNDMLMLQKAPFSIGVNGADAARAAKIGVVTDNMMNLMPILEIIDTYSGDISIEQVIRHAQFYAPPNTIIHKGGEDIPPELLSEHKKMKSMIRAKNVIY